ncbi:YrhK family protein [Roseibium marinum]|uniref:YrhK-like protein n=1 Tax=Roseibium marinum TaxID=281252 RepID=A0A2S3UNR4_9HYPH|nr:YrhK family protein [Roseibium marinum]POF29345.1 YrhK-like protein [Roseibium marinum]
MSRLFDTGNRTATADHAEVVRKYELYRTLVEFLAAFAFVVGSVFFFYESLLYAGTWLFLVGSILFAVRPSIRLLLELRLANLPVPDEFRPYGAGPEKVKSPRADG